MATKQHGRRAADAKVKTPLTELTELLNANSGVFGRRAAVVAASGGLLTAAVMPAAGQGADDQSKVSAEAETTQKVDFENQTVTIGDDSNSKKDKKDDEKSDSFGVESKAITAEAQWSGKFLSGFPIAALIAINLLDPHYYDEVIDHPWFIPACFVVGGFLLVNLVVMRMLVNIKV